jgi:hypothetical protein
MMSGTRWFQKKGVLQGHDGMMAEIELTTYNTHLQYEGYKVTILDKKNGSKLTATNFWFGEYLDRTQRADDRKDHDESFKIIDHCGKDWYIATPTEKEIRKMALIISEYIGLYL